MTWDQAMALGRADVVGVVLIVIIQIDIDIIIPWLVHLAVSNGLSDLSLINFCLIRQMSYIM